MTGAWPWLAVAGVGALHGLNPATGWAFVAAWRVRVAGAGADRDRPRRVGRAGRGAGAAGPRRAARRAAVAGRWPGGVRRGRPRVGTSAATAACSDGRGRAVAVVVRDGHGPWRRDDAGADADPAVRVGLAGARDHGVGFDAAGPGGRRAAPGGDAGRDGRAGPGDEPRVRAGQTLAATAARCQKYSGCCVARLASNWFTALKF